VQFKAIFQKNSSIAPLINRTGIEYKEEDILEVRKKFSATKHEPQLMSVIHEYPIGESLPSKIESLKGKGD